MLENGKKNEDQKKRMSHVSQAGVFAENVSQQKGSIYHTFVLEINIRLNHTFSNPVCRDKVFLSYILLTFTHLQYGNIGKINKTPERKFVK